MKFGVFIKQKREAAGISIYRLAKLTGISEPQISNYEAGRSEITLERAKSICRALGCTFLIGDAGNALPNNVEISGKKGGT